MTSPLETPSNSDPSNPLPGDEKTWAESDVGLAAKWPGTLRSFATTISSLPYPAAIFGTRQLILLHNHAWAEASDITGQGQAQSDKLAAEVSHFITACFDTRQPAQTSSSRHFLRAQPHVRGDYTVLLSPLLDDPRDHDPAAVLAQLIPHDAAQGLGDAQDSASQKDVDAADDTARNDIPCAQHLNGTYLDEHPFFHRVAEMLPTGLAVLDHQAKALFVNHRFYELTTHHDEDKLFTAWPQSIHPDDYDRVMHAYQEAVRDQKDLRIEFRALGEQYRWRLLLLTPIGNDNFDHVNMRDTHGFICSIVDITSEKSAELSERTAAREAEERKKQQERFIDMISHEIRNPLSAILHCAEDIDVAITEKSPQVDLESIQRAVETINLCIAHQRKIVDDVLGFSKLDSSMLALVPKPIQPSRHTAESLKMFEPEFRKQRVELKYRIDTSYVDFDVSWVLADPTRVGQVLVNLITNAIKFTATSKSEKTVTVSVGASRERPTSYPPDVVFFDSDDRAYRMDATNSNEWGNGEAGYILVAVKDTGIGISKERQKVLFERFRQATPKTSEVYGGTGLGLNICRKLCHLHGGEIGVASRENEGSTFSFFYKFRRTDDPATSGQQVDASEDTDEVADQIEKAGLTSPKLMEPDLLPGSLLSPPILEVNESMSPNRTLDERYQETASVAAQVPQPEHDAYATSERPEVSRAHLSGERRESKEVASTLDEHSRNPSSHGPRRLHILLAEDNIVNQRILFRKLEKHGFNVTTANNGQEAVDCIRNAPKLTSGNKAAFDIVLMDQEMPVMDGSAAAKAIRELESRGEVEHVPILGVTANVRDDQQDEMVLNGMDDVISKPYKIDELVAKMTKLFESAREVKEGASPG